MPVSVHSVSPYAMCGARDIGHLLELKFIYEVDLLRYSDSDLTVTCFVRFDRSQLANVSNS